VLKYIRGELYRLFHKKSIYIFFTALAAGYLLITYIRSGGFKAESIADDAIQLFQFLPVLAGGFLFAAINTDDLNCKNLISLVGFGLSKIIIVISKFILITLLCAIVFGLAPLLHCGVYSLLGWTATVGTWTAVYAISVKYFLITVAFSVLSGIVVYGLQRTTFAIVTYILLAFGIVSGLLTTGLRTFAPGLTRYLMSGISDKIMINIISGGSLTSPITQYVVYVAIVMALSALVFHKKEMEF
jgi:hypothetical protein